MKRILLFWCAVLCTLYAFGELKYVFYFIGDGMGSNQVLGAEMYRSALQGQPLGRVQTLMTTFPYSGSASSYSTQPQVRVWRPGKRPKTVCWVLIRTPLLSLR